MTLKRIIKGGLIGLAMACVTTAGARCPTNLLMTQIIGPLFKNQQLDGLYSVRLKLTVSGGSMWYGFAVFKQTSNIAVAAQRKWQLASRFGWSTFESRTDLTPFGYAGRSICRCRNPAINTVLVLIDSKLFYREIH